MSVLITNAFVNQYKSNVIQLAQQKGSRLESKVRVERDVNSNQYFFERLAKAAAVKKVSRHSDTPQLDSNHDRRMVTLVDYEWADLIDKEDKVRILINPESEYAIAAANALGRAKDDEIITAFNGPAFSGVNGATSVVFPAGNKVAVAASGLTLAKLLSAKQIIDTADVDPEIPRYILFSPVHVTDLLNTTEIKNADYNTVKALAMGQINTFLGFNFVMSNRLAKSLAGDTSAVMAWAQTGMAFAVASDIKTRITERADKSYSVQVYVCGTFGATRVEDEKVVEIACND